MTGADRDFPVSGPDGLDYIVRGPIRQSRFNYTQATMVHREYVADEAALPAAVEDLAARVRRGEVPSVATRT